MADNELPIIAIVGRPNVGKSALFNRIVGRRISIVHEQSGVTRDSIVAPVHRLGHHCLLVDTGGLGVLVKEKRVDTFDGLIRDQVAAVVEDADVVIWVVDCHCGTTPLDHEIGDLLRASECTVVMAANKADNDAYRESAGAEFADLSAPALIPTSCTQNYGIRELMERCFALLPESDAQPAEPPAMQLAVVGRPNVGKSSLVNCILGEDRVMVSEIAGTTRDAVDVPFRFSHGDHDVPMALIDTAGLRRQRQVDTVVEFFSATRAESAIRRSDAVLFVLDATAPATAQDRRIARMINDARKPCILIVNKWDLLSGQMKQKDLIALFRDRLRFMQHAPMAVICALSGYSLDSVFDLLVRLREQMRIKVPTSVVNRFVQDVLMRNPPSSTGNRILKVMYATMKGNPPPRFLLFVNHKEACSANYLRFLENQFREAFFPETGLPIEIELRERRTDKESEHGGRQAIAGVVREKRKVRQANARHESRRKGWRKKKKK
ncbi:MAG: ribosome biogenesis GTPase Der [Lentisphaerae bacterium]|jgi:GTPase|nr:ribosome biogenesis GTPase Der [Lentisphaerota bacterium]MBT4814512.1 ribosome biogenesis GTPase Der [Lentisphaerota bacterium]MBT5605203.1 ribosome biogenesis GTPase Der [Lentisphaerota bacterium]MBT7054345.1 ribosome biogenesis GTPase Der [Lentisphaerota bacterium]MBT7844871.1 ribosome biogenesis GTPase Der [Lentisphaerota bacterium]